MLIGVDEAGRGPIIGPLIIGAAAVEDESFLKDIKVRDSKAYTPRLRERTFEKLVGNIVFSHICYSSEDVDEAVKSSNLNWLEVKGFSQAILGIYHKLRPRFNGFWDFIGKSRIFLDSCDVKEERFGKNVAQALIDNCMKEGILKNCLNDEITELTEHVQGIIVSKHKADDIFPVVSAASVIAKSFREREVESIKKELGANFGSGYPSDARTRKYLERYYKKNRKFPKHTRLSWKTTNKIISKVSTSPLDRYF